MSNTLKIKQAKYTYKIKINYSKIRPKMTIEKDYNPDLNLSHKNETIYVAENFFTTNKLLKKLKTQFHNISNISSPSMKKR